jgi:hypothetical protein
MITIAEAIQGFISVRNRYASFKKPMVNNLFKLKSEEYANKEINQENLSNFITDTVTDYRHHKDNAKSSPYKWGMFQVPCILQNGCNHK